MTQTTETDFARYSQLSEAEQNALNEALASIPDDILSTGDRPAIETRIKRRLQREGLLPTDEAGGLMPGTIPPIAYVGRAAACLAANASNMRSISHNKPADAVAESIAQSISGCVSGGAAAIKADIMRHRKEVAAALTAVELPSLGAALVATWGD